MTAGITTLQDDCRGVAEISVSAAASAAIAELSAEHGELLFHVTGGCCDARTPICLRREDLSLGARDVLIGTADGVPVYEMADVSQDRCASSYRLDVVEGVPVGFSLLPGTMKRFALRQVVV